MKLFNRIFVLLLFASFLFACQTKENNANNDSAEVAEDANDDKFQTQKSEQDADFIAEAVAANYAEIEIAQLGIQRSDNSEIKKVGRELEAEHNKMLKNLQDLANKKTISVPLSSNDSDRRKIDDLNGEEKIRDFNKEWCETMVKKHEESIKKFEERLAKTEDPDVKNLVNDALPHLRTHLEKVKACHDKIAEAQY
jgi:putative membrane protein